MPDAGKPVGHKEHDEGELKDLKQGDHSLGYVEIVLEFGEYVFEFENSQ